MIDWSVASCPTDAFLYRIDVTVLLYSALSTTPYRVRDKAVVILVEMFIFKIFLLINQIYTEHGVLCTLYFSEHYYRVRSTLCEKSTEYISVGMIGNYHTNVRRSTGQRAAAVTFFFSLFTFSLSHSPQSTVSFISSLNDSQRISIESVSNPPKQLIFSSHPYGVLCTHTCTYSYSTSAHATHALLGRSAGAPYPVYPSAG